jgi:7-carboxy-7-deazaguanine synthase
MAKGYLSEIFTSLQGEGPYVGSRQIFVRFSGCSLQCNFCDTKNSWKRTDQFTIDIPEKYGLEKIYQNPISHEETIAIIQKIINKEPKLHSIFLTGGEPLEQKEYFHALVIGLKKSGLQVYLETNTVNYKNLYEVKEHIDIISADVKMIHPDFEKNLSENLCNFLSIPFKNELFLKIPVNTSLDLQLFQKTIKKISAVRNNILVIIQPLSEELLPKPDQKLIDKLLDFQNFALNHFNDVRVIPQIHKFLKIK